MSSFILITCSAEPNQITCCQFQANEPNLDTILTEKDNLVIVILTVIM